MPEPWRYAWLYYNPEHLKKLDVQALPVYVCGLLGRLLPVSSVTEQMRASIAGRLRGLLRPGWMQQADLGQLAAALDGLHACAPQLIDGRDVVIFAKRLLAAEVAVGGPYYRSGKVIDPLTNAFIAQCLEWMAAPLPNLNDFLRSRLPEIETVDAADVALLAALQYRDPVLAPYIGAVQAALCLSILDAVQPAAASDKHESGLVRRIHDNCLRRLPSFSEPFSTNTHGMLRQVMQADANHEVSLLAWYYGQALAGNKTLTADRQMFVDLGTANVYAWAAYSIYDDFLDDEGQPPLLGTANYSFRAMLRQYQAVMPDNSDFQRFVEQALTVVDQANALETTSFRLSVSEAGIIIGKLPDFDDRSLLADRALFHVIGPMAVLAASDKAKVGDAVWDSTLQALRHYLIARQLNDDIHDWVKDLQAGQATYVVVSLLRYLNTTPGYYSFRDLLPYAREQFWRHVLPHICDIALAHVAAARQHLRTSLPLASGSKFIILIDYVEDSMRAALAQRRKSQQLLQSFGTDPSGR